jgi:hypothetical protein
MAKPNTGTTAEMVNLPRQPVSSGATWLAADLAGDRSWISEFSPGDIAELENAVEQVKAEGLELYQVGRGDFALPELGPKIRSAVEEVENGRGVVLWRGLDPSGYDQDTLKMLYWGIGTHLGTPITHNAKGDLIGHVRDQGGDYMDKNVRGYTTRSRLAPHCDSSDVVTLLCLHPAKSGGQSVIASSTAIYNEILRTRPEYLEVLAEGFHFDLRGEGATGDADEVTYNRVPVFSWFAGRLSCRYNRKTIEDGQAKAGKPLSGPVLEAVRYVGEVAMKDGIRFDMTFRQGDIQILNNHTVLHSREDFEDWPEPERKRNLMRMWLNLDDDIARPLAPEFADRMNTGPRGGVAVRP